MRKLLVSLAAVGLVVTFAAPAGAAKGPLKVGTNLPAPGFWDGPSGGSKPEDINGGLEYDLSAAIAKKLGYDGVDVKNVSFDALVARKARGFDLAFSQVTITKERKKVVDFSTPYFSSDQGILVNKGTKVDESNIKSTKWGVQTATTAQEYLKDKVKPDTDPKVYQETSQAFAALQAGQIDAVLLDTAIVLQQASASNGQFEVVGQFKTGEKYGAVFNKGSKIEKKVNKAIKALRTDGTLATLTADNIGGDPAKIPFLKP